MRWRLVRVRGASMNPTLVDGDVLLVRTRADHAEPGQIGMVRLPGQRPVAVKRLVERRDGGWWVERDNPTGGVDSWQVGAIAQGDLLGVVRARIWPRPRRLGSGAVGRSRTAPVAYALALGAVSWVFSEGMFWAQWREEDTVPGVLLTWLVYSVISYLALASARQHSVSTVAGLFLVGAYFGWLAEGAIAGTVFADPPSQVVWTGLAWHAPLTVCFGWWALPTVLRAGRLRDRLLTAAALGAAFGAWSAGFVHEPDGDGVPSIAGYAAYAAGVTAVLAIAYPLCDRLAPDDTPPRRGVLAAAASATLAWFVLSVAIAIPWAVLGLAVLLAVPLVVLARARRPDPPARLPLLSAPAAAMRARDVSVLALTPLVSVACFAALEPVAGDLPVVVTYLITVPASVIALVWSIARVRRAGA